MVWGHVRYNSKHSDSPGHVSTKQGNLWAKVVCIDKSCRLLIHGSNNSDGGRSGRSDDSLGAESGLSGEEEDRQRVVRKHDERKVEVAESRRGYVRGAVWDEGNMIQAMARLKNPTIAWRYGDG